MLSITSFDKFVTFVNILIDNNIWNPLNIVLHGLRDDVFRELELWTLNTKISA